MANELPEINPFNAVYQSEKYYDFDPSSFKNVLPTLKTVGGGIANILLPQDATDVAMMAVPPVAVYNRVKKILDRVDTLRAEARSLFNSFNRGSRSNKDIREAQLKNNEADSMVKDIPEDDMKIYNEYKKSLTSDEVNKQGIARLRRTIGQKPSNFKSVSDNPSPLYSDILNKLSKDNPNELPELTKQIMKDNSYTTSGIKIIANQNQITPKEAAHLKSMLGQHTLKKLGRDSGENVYEYRGHELFNPKGYGGEHSYSITPPGANGPVDTANNLTDAKLIIDKMLDEI